MICKVDGGFNITLEKLQNSMMIGLVMPSLWSGKMARYFRVLFLVPSIIHVL
jgi:hypothetical protein